MARLTKIYTRAGDKGETGLVGGQRVSKDSPRIWAYGTVDELNSAIGLARALKPDKETNAVLAGIQNNLFNLGAELAMPSRSPVRVEKKQIAALERLMDERNAKLGPLREFILPGGSPVAAQLHVARTICRRAERFCVRLAREEDRIGATVVPYLNRLSDALFVLARWANKKQGVKEVCWKK
ncbi:MAG TPA: cob(I)yrinic acid a,c-diamide adenosyltransferase [Verrucomicrobiae bacterium]|nr:cob(I)yrinic acid a,c-diamide adenosyltransferase [Verrucomicrobiae bacterium]